MANRSPTCYDWKKKFIVTSCLPTANFALWA
jgi:hypothetical protein